MKKLLVAVVALVAFANVNAQDSHWGVKAGFNSTSIKASAEGSSASESASGFYIGIYNDFSISEDFDIHPELQYISISEDGANTNFLALPVLAKYNATEKLSILAGPQFDYLLDEDSDGLKKLGIGLATGLSFNLTENLMLDGRYSFGLSNRLEDNEFEGIEVDVKFNFIQIGLGYRF